MLSLHAAIIPNWLQMLGAVDGLLDKAKAHLENGGIEEQELLQTRLIEDMLPLAYQVKSCWVHTARALEGARAGRFSPDTTPPPRTIADLRILVREAIAACEGVEEDALATLADNPMIFSIGDKFRLDFTVADFLMSFSTPNLFFHAATAYDLLRMRGVALGKRDYLGGLRVQPG